jgi:hypothetical protein
MDLSRADHKWLLKTRRFLAVVATQGLTHCGLVKPIQAPGARSFFPLAAPVSVFRRSSRSMSFVLAGGGSRHGPGWAPRSGRSTLTSPQRRKDRQLRRGDDGPTSESKRNVLGKKSQWVPLTAELEVSARQRFIVDGHKLRRTWPAAELGGGVKHPC